MDTRDSLSLSASQVKGVVAATGGSGGASDVINRDNVRVVHLSIPSSVVSQHSVIQSVSPASVQLAGKNNVILLNSGGGAGGAGGAAGSKQPTTGVIQTSAGTFHNIQVLDAVQAGESGGGGVYVEDGSRGRREILSRRPSYRRILNELGGAVSEEKVDSPDDPNGVIKVIPASALQLTSSDNIHNLQNISCSTPAGTTASASTLVQYTQASDGQYFVPVSIPVSGSLKLDQHETSHQMVLSASGELIEEVAKKREVRLLKNREAAKECRRKKKEYIKCLENRVAVLENQNKALIEELKSLKELYCQNKP